MSVKTESVSLDGIKDEARALSVNIGQYIEGQAALWQRLEYWIIRAIGTPYFSGDELYAIRTGLLPIRFENPFLQTVKIDLATGEPSIAHWIYYVDRLEAFNAQQILGELKQRSHPLDCRCHSCTTPMNTDLRMWFIGAFKTKPDPGMTLPAFKAAEIKYRGLTP